MWDCPFDWYHFYNIELQQITAKIMVTRQTIRQPRKTVQQDQVELRTGQWTAFVKTQFWRLGNRTTSKIDGSSRDSGSMIRFDSFNFLWTVHFRQRYVILDRSFPPRWNHRKFARKITNFPKFLNHQPQNFDPKFQIFSPKLFKP